MANPNIAAVTDIKGNTYSVAVGTSATQVVSNPPSSGGNMVYKINTIMVTNIDGSASAEVTVNIHSAAGLGGSPTAIASTIAVPADSTLIVTDKTTSFYLLEDRSIGAIASAAGDLVITCSWEEITSP